MEPGENQKRLNLKTSISASKQVVFMSINK
jgi:hypothetical protein